jgi:glycosyltransferase involved in cell wall biosynthesis
MTSADTIAPVIVASEAVALITSKLPRILVILPYPPNPLRPRTASMLNDLSTFAEIDLIYLDHGERAKLPSDVNIRNVVVIPNRQAGRLFRLATGCLRGKPFVYQFYHSRALIRHLKSLDLSAYSAVYVERLPLHELPISHPNVIFDPVDCCTQQVRQCASRWPGPRRFLYKLDSLWIAKYEAKLCNRATKLICTAEREAEGFKSIGVLRPILVVLHASNAVEFMEHKIVDRPKKVLSFHGKLSYVANRLALRKISQAILPKLDSNRYEVLVAGAGSEKLRNRHLGIRFVGFVDDIVTYLRSVDLSIFPIEISAGVSNKVLESLAAGVPSIITPQIAAGLPEGDRLLERGIFVREIREFGGAIHNYFRIPLVDRQRISNECIDYASNLQSPARRRILLRGYILNAIP